MDCINCKYEKHMSKLVMNHCWLSLKCTVSHLLICDKSGNTHNFLKLYLQWTVVYLGFNYPSLFLQLNLPGKCNIKIFWGGFGALKVLVMDFLITITCTVHMNLHTKFAVTRPSISASMPKFIDCYNIMTWGIYVSVSGKDPLMEGKTISDIADFCPPNHNL